MVTKTSWPASQILLEVLLEALEVKGRWRKMMRAGEMIGRKTGRGGGRGRFHPTGGVQISEKNLLIF